MHGFFKINTINVFSLPCDFNIVFSLALLEEYSISYIHEICICSSIVYIIGKASGPQQATSEVSKESKFTCGLSTVWRSGLSTLVLFKDQLYKSLQMY